MDLSALPFPTVAILGAMVAGAVVLIVAVRLSRRRRPGASELILDGSNVMHWRGDVPDLDTVRDVLRTLVARGFAPGVIFDANAGYLVSDRYRDDAWFAKRLGLPVARVLVVPKGVPADVTILRAARERGARIVTNDRYRDWTDLHPEVADPGHLVRGDYRGGSLRIDPGPLGRGVAKG